MLITVIGVQVNLITVERMAVAAALAREAIDERMRLGHLRRHIKIGGTVCRRKADRENWLTRQAVVQGALVAPGFRVGCPRNLERDGKIQPARIHL